MRLNQEMINRPVEHVSAVNRPQRSWKVPSGWTVALHDFKSHQESVLNETSVYLQFKALLLSKLASPLSSDTIVFSPVCLE